MYLRTVDELLAVSSNIEATADAVADSVVTERPELDRDGIRKAVVQELWLAVCEVTNLARSGAVLS